jgi:hypothetical protein
MKRILPLLLFIFISFCFLVKPASGQSIQLPPGVFRVTVGATVGGLYFNISGMIAPNASIVLTIDGIFARSTIADQNGYFYMSDVLIKPGFSHFCLDAIDFKRLGESYTCFDIPPAIESVVMKDVFLPPTLGLSRTEITEGATAKAYGYTMPKALVTLYVNGEKLTTYADPTGYYEFSVKNLKAGNYSIYARAELNNKQSLEPTKKLHLKSLSWWDQFIAFLKNLWNKLLKFLTNLALGPLWLLVPIIILIIILLVKLFWPVSLPLPFKKRRPLHHKWWMGY